MQGADNEIRQIAPLRVRRRTATQAEIAEAAASLFERYGFENVTVEQIATAAGISMRTFYRHCSGKDEALSVGLSAGPEELAAAIGKHQDLPLLEAVVAGFVEVSDSPVRRSELRLILGTPALRASWLAAGRAAQEDLVGIVRQHFPAITVFEAQARAAAIISILTVVLEAWTAAEDDDLPLRAQQALRVLTDW